MSEKELKRLNDQIQSLAKQLGKQIEIFDMDNINAAESTLKGLKAEINDIVSDIGGIAAGFKSVVDEISTSSKPLADTKKSFNSLSSLAQKLKNDQEGISKLNEKDLQSINEKVRAERANLVTTRDVLVNKSKEEKLSNQEKDALGEINGILQGNDGLYRSLLITAKDRLKVEENLNDAFVY